MSSRRDEVFTARRRLLAAFAVGATVTAVGEIGAAQGLFAGERYRFDRALFPRYRLAVEIDRRARSLSARCDIQVPPHLIRDDAIVFALSEGALHVRVNADVGHGATAPVIPIKREDATTPGYVRRWTAPLPQRGDAQMVRLHFEYDIMAPSSPLFAITADGAVASGTASSWYPQVESERGVRLEGTGELSVRCGSDIVVGGGRSAGNGHFHVDAPRYFDFAAAAYRAVPSRGGRARLYVLRDHPGAEIFVEKLERLIDVLEGHFGPLPQQRFDLAEAPPLAARDGGFDGASLDGFMLAIGSYFDQPFNTAFFGHEVSHQWWGGLVRRVGLDGAYVLDESLAQFGSMLAVEDLEDVAAAELYRRRGFPGYYGEYSGFTYLARSLEGIDAPITALPLSDGFIARRVVNSKGMLVWRMLEQLVGRQTLLRFLRGFIRTHAYKRASLADLMGRLRALLGTQAWFVDDWFDRPGPADLRLEWRQVGRDISCVIVQAPPFKRVRAPIEVHYADGTISRHQVLIEGHETHFVLRSRALAATIVLDPHYEVLRWTQAYHAEAQAIRSYTRGDIALNYGRTSEARTIFAAALETAIRPEQGPLRALLLRGLGDAALADEQRQAAVRYYNDALQATAPVQRQSPEIWRALADAYRGLGEDALARAANEEGARAIAALIAEGPERET